MKEESGSLPTFDAFWLLTLSDNKFLANSLTCAATSCLIWLSISGVGWIFAWPKIPISVSWRCFIWSVTLIISSWLSSNPPNPKSFINSDGSMSYCGGARTHSRSLGLFCGVSNFLGTGALLGVVKRGGIAGVVNVFGFLIGPFCDYLNYLLAGNSLSISFRLPNLPYLALKTKFSLFWWAFEGCRGSGLLSGDFFLKRSWAGRFPWLTGTMPVPVLPCIYCSKTVFSFPWYFLLQTIFWSDDSRPTVFACAVMGFLCLSFWMTSTTGRSFPSLRNTSSHRSRSYF